MFRIENNRECFYQWDSNQRLIIDDDTINEVHYCNRTDKCSIVTETYEENGVRYSNVPNVLLRSDWCINVYAFDTNYTKYSELFKVCSRTRPADYVYTETQILNWNEFKASVEAELEEMREDIDNIDISGIDLEGYATEDYVKEYAQPKGDYLTLEDYRNMNYLGQAASHINITENSTTDLIHTTDGKMYGALKGDVVLCGGIHYIYDGYKWNSIKPNMNGYVSNGIMQAYVDNAISVAIGGVENGTY